MKKIEKIEKIFGGMAAFSLGMFFTKIFEWAALSQFLQFATIMFGVTGILFSIAWIIIAFIIADEA